MKNFTNFSFHMATEIVFGRKTELEVARLIRKHGGKKVMIVYGGGSIKKMGLYDTVVTTLDGAKIPYIELGGVQPNPRRSLVEKGLKMAQDENVDFMLAVGGGSSIDTAKAIALGLANGGAYWQFYNGTAPEKMAPVGTIHTISAAGSETSGSSVIVDDIGTGRKTSFMYPNCRPVFAIMNPELTYSVSRFQTGAGSADILAHTVNRYFMNAASNLCDEYGEGTMRTVVKYAPIAVANPNDYEARAELMLAGSFSHNDLTSIGRSGPRGGEHALEAQLSGTYDTAHGAGLAMVMPAWLQYIADHGNPEQVARVAQFGVKVFGANPDMADVKATADDGLNRFRAWVKSIEMPLTLKELGVPKEDLQSVIDKCNCDDQGILRGYMDLDKKAVAAIFSSIVE
ncbi:MAG: iron-containing alcohol dehydrogenase [Oscillospiraceae bacterium]|jgi:alcohol dehydrogenase YqhD (iron-dependent ADH family)|nr:iron-containing alcohol dehydrogenase [Oscillospiraceae bacterium]